MKKKILFLSAWYPNRYDSMAGLFVKRHAETVSSKFDVAILYPWAVENLSTTYEIETFVESNLLTIYIYYRKPKSNLPFVTSMSKVYRFIKAYYIGLRQLKSTWGLPLLVHSNILTRTGFIALLIKIWYGIPYIITEHWSRYLPERGEYKGWLRKLLTQIVVSQSLAIATVSERLKVAMINAGITHSNFQVIRNVVDCSFFRPMNVSPYSEKKVFVHISCFDNKAKNNIGIVRAVSELSKLRQDFVCLMIGDGPDFSEVRSFAAKLGLSEEYLVFTGLREGGELVKLINQSLFTMLFSNYENMPVVIAESFACGKPVLSTCVGGIPEILDSSRGKLINPGNEAVLIESLNYMLDHDHLFDPKAIRQYALLHFSSEAVSAQLQKLYQS